MTAYPPYDIYAEHVFAPGQQVTCTDSRGYCLTVGKVYTITRYEAPSYCADIGYRWPAYVHTVDDFGGRTVCHATRFTPL